MNQVAIYARVSTEEQTELNQVRVLEDYAEKQGWQVAGLYTDTGSAFQHTDQKQLKLLLSECQRKHYDLVLVFDVSRLTRKGPLELMMLLKQFADKGAPVHSYLDSAINVPNEFQPVLVAIYGMMAKLFSTQLSARTRAGMARARAQGKHVGRPRKKGLANTKPLSENTEAKTGSAGGGEKGTLSGTAERLNHIREKMQEVRDDTHNNPADRDR